MSSDPITQAASVANSVGDATLIRRVNKRETQEGERRRSTNKAARRKVDGFLSAFEGAGLSDERLDNASSVPLAKKIITTSRGIGDKICGFDKSINTAIKTQAEEIPKKITAQQKQVVVHPSILIALVTFSVGMEAVLGMIRNLVEGFIEGVIKVSGAFSDALQEQYRQKFAPTNDYQEIAIAILYFLATTITTIATLLGNFFIAPKNLLVTVAEKFFGKDVGTCTMHAWNILFVYAQIRIILHFATLKVILFAALVLTILSFFLKMDDYDEPAPVEAPKSTSSSDATALAEAVEKAPAEAAATAAAAAAPHEEALQAATEGAEDKEKSE